MGMSQNLYTIATANSKCAGHGDNYTSMQICGIGPYGSPPYPPVFKNRVYAESFIKNDQSKPFSDRIMKYGNGFKVVELNLVDYG